MLIEEILIIRHGDVSFGVPTSFIGQILRVPDITPLALSPSQVRGLCAVGGDIVTLLDFNLLLGLEATKGVDQKNRVITLSAPLNVLALLVDEVTVSLGIDQDRIEYLNAKDEAIVAIYHHEETLIQIVDLDHMINSVKRVSISANSVHEKGVDETKSAFQSRETERYLVFKMGMAEYALAIDDLREIINANSTITSIAGANSEIEGMMSLRDELVIVADLRRYYNAVPKISDKNRIIITQRHGKTLGLIIDEIIDIHEFSKSDIDMTNNGGEESLIAGVIRNGEKLISLVGISVLDGLFARNDEIIVANDTVELSAEEVPAIEVVIFQLGDEEYAFNIEEVAEIIDMTPVTPVAGAPEMVDGVINIRGQIVTIGSLHKRLGIAPCGENDQKIIICHAPVGRIGFFVNSVSNVLGINPGQMREEEDKEGLFSNVLHLDEGKRLVLLFNPDISKLIKGAA